MKDIQIKPYNATEQMYGIYIENKLLYIGSLKGCHEMRKKAEEQSKSFVDSIMSACKKENIDKDVFVEVLVERLKAESYI